MRKTAMIPSSSNNINYLTLNSRMSAVLRNDRMSGSKDSSVVSVQQVCEEPTGISLETSREMSWRILGSLNLPKETPWTFLDSQQNASQSCIICFSLGALH